jgi:hypothetical protein
MVRPGRNWNNWNEPTDEEFEELKNLPNLPTNISISGSQPDRSLKHWTLGAAVQSRLRAFGSAGDDGFDDERVVGTTVRKA